MPELTPVALARESIDVQLLAVGWEVQDRDKINLSASRGAAIRELPSSGGPADYVLFVDGKALGVVEAKKAGTTLIGVEEQAARYARARKWIPQRWADPLPFTYESTGVETLVVDRRDPEARSRPVYTFHRPEHLLSLVKEGSDGPDAATLRARLQNMPEIAEEGFRDCQLHAIRGLETSLAANRPRALIQMATGAGKTYFSVHQVYRLLKHAGARRVLFLVDRANLGRQALREFQNFPTPGDGRKFTQLYNVQLLGPAGLDPVSKVVISTVQRLWSQLSGYPLDDDADEASGYDLEGTTFLGDRTAPREIQYNSAIPIETFDFIIIDECHRSIYNLWSQVLEYFDSFLIGLTATPAKHTFGYFNQNLVTEYSHQQAVADGVNVGYDIYRIKTEVSEEGGTLESGFNYQRRDRLTREKRWTLQDEEEDFDRVKLDRTVESPDQIRTVLQCFKQKLFVDLYPDRPARASAQGLKAPWVPKTLVYAKDDAHAERIVEHVREVFDRGNDFCKKITYRVGKKEADNLINLFRNDPAFRVAVTVDMVATGTDVRPLECVLFFRDVKSQVYFEQMKGRGTRTISPTELAAVTPDAGTKTRFVLVDAVGVTESDKTDSRPLERKPSVPFEKLLTSVALGALDDDTLTSLANRLARLDRSLTDDDRTEIEKLSGGTTIKELASDLLKASDPDHLESIGGPTSESAVEFVENAVKPLATNPDLRALLERKRRKTEITIDHVTQDKVLEAGYDEEKAQALIANWKRFIEENKDQLTALQILYNLPHTRRTKPGSQLVYGAIKSLADAVGRPPYHIAPAEVWKAYEHLERQPLTQDPVKTLTNLIVLVRHAIDPEHAPLAPFPELVEHRFQIWLGQQETDFSQSQLEWLEIIKNYIALNGAFETEDKQRYLEAWQHVDSSEAVPLAVARKVFGGDPKLIIKELNGVLVA